MKSSQNTKLVKGKVGLESSCDWWNAGQKEIRSQRLIYENKTLGGHSGAMWSRFLCKCLQDCLSSKLRYSGHLAWNRLPSRQLDLLQHSPDNRGAELADHGSVKQLWFPLCVICGSIIYLHRCTLSDPVIILLPSPSVWSCGFQWREIYPSTAFRNESWCARSWIGAWYPDALYTF